MAEISFDQFSRKLLGAANGIRAAEAKITLAGAGALASEVAAAYGAVTGDGKLSGTGKARRGSGRQASVGAKAKDVRRYSDGTYVGLVVPTGAYGLLERNIAPHEISVFRYSARRRNTVLRAARKAAYAQDRSAVQATRVARAGLDARQSTALRIPGSRTGYANSVQHPGTRAKQVFSRAVRAGGHKVNQKMLAETSKQMLAGYRGRG